MPRSAGPAAQAWPRSQQGAAGRQPSGDDWSSCSRPSARTAWSHTAAGRNRGLHHSKARHPGNPHVLLPSGVKGTWVCQPPPEETEAHRGGRTCPRPRCQRGQSRVLTSSSTPRHPTATLCPPRGLVFTVPGNVPERASCRGDSGRAQGEQGIPSEGPGRASI